MNWRWQYLQFKVVTLVVGADDGCGAEAYVDGVSLGCFFSTWSLKLACRQVVIIQIVGSRKQDADVWLFPLKIITSK